MLLNQFKSIESTSEQIKEATYLSTIERKLSVFDLLNYVICRDNSCTLATGDNCLKKYCEKNNIKVIRTLKIIKELYNLKIISKEKSIEACIKLKESFKVRIPIKEIDNLIKELEKDSN